MKEENFNEKENCSAAFKYCDGVFLNSMWKRRHFPFATVPLRTRSMIVKDSSLSTPLLIR